MRLLFSICVLFSLTLRAQDKLFFLDGSVKKGIIVSIGKELVYFKASDTSALQKIDKKDLAMTENYNGLRFIFNSQSGKETTAVPLTSNYKRNNIGVQPFAVFAGRGTFVYERYTANHKIGFVFPLSITFDPFGSLYNLPLDSVNSVSKRIPGVNFIGGADVNFYLGQNEKRCFFMGPRFRYGTDLLIGGVEAWTLQTQVGWRLGAPSQAFSQYLSFGFGFANVITTFSGPVLQSKQFYGWYSVNYRIGINW